MAVFLFLDKLSGSDHLYVLFITEYWKYARKKKALMGFLFCRFFLKID